MWRELLVTVAVAASPAWADGGTGYEPLAEAGLSEVEPCSDVVWANDLEARVTCGASATLELSVVVHPDGACLRVERGEVAFEALVDRGSGSFEIHPTHLDPDGELDVVVAFAGMGCGLASAWRHVVVVASGPSGFSAWSFDSLGFGRRSLQRRRGELKAALVQSELAQGTGADGRPHSWFVHRFLAMQDGEFVRIDEPPAWTWFTLRQNHMPAVGPREPERSRLQAAAHARAPLPLATPCPGSPGEAR